MTEPLVLLPGMNCSPSLWAGLELPHVVTPTLDEPHLNDEVIRLLDRLPPRFALAGLSLGGIVAMALLRTAPARVSRLCLLSTSARPPTDRQRASWTGQRARLASGLDARGLQQELLPLLISPEPSRAVVDATLQLADETGTERLDRQLALQADRVDERPALPRISCPTTVIAAADDLLCPLDRHQEITALIPAARLVVLDRAAHLSPLERPVEVAAALRAWRSGTD